MFCSASLRGEVETGCWVVMDLQWCLLPVFWLRTWTQVLNGGYIYNQSQVSHHCSFLWVTPLYYNDLWSHSSTGTDILPKLTHFSRASIILSPNHKRNQIAWVPQIYSTSPYMFCTCFVQSGDKLLHWQKGDYHRLLWHIHPIILFFFSICLCGVWGP